jgi:hypothetical protein
MKPWTERNQVLSALQNKHVRMGKRPLPNGHVLRGLYATRDFEKGDFVASFHGPSYTPAQLKEIGRTDPLFFDRIAEYGIRTPLGETLVPKDLDQVGGHLINHACGPNAEWSRYEQSSVLVEAARPIAKDEEITAHYGWLGVKAAVEDKRHACACESRLCAGTIELYVEMVYTEQEDETGARTGGPCLSVDEIARRLLVDIVNDTNYNEALIIRYSKESLGMVLGATVVQAPDDLAFWQKVLDAAKATVLVARKWQSQGKLLSEKRLKQIVKSYRLESF